MKPPTLKWQTAKIWIGIALGLPPVKLQWLQSCLQKKAWDLPAPHQILSPRRGLPAPRPEASALLLDWVVIPCGNPKFMAEHSALLRAMGAEVRRDLPVLHHHAVDAEVEAASSRLPACAVLAAPDAGEKEYGLLARARE